MTSLSPIVHAEVMERGHDITSLTAMKDLYLSLVAEEFCMLKAYTIRFLCLSSACPLTWSYR